ncbi:hypothetical protein [Plantibacter sp. ME-Dv--P-095]|uniref:hypothetical protein n=1 Tax=Plantibacter sp. ME-Dv--P-095 TaxID=3040299 RepID=UPI00254DFCF2|nr:hypothetical protein [Plantibacter sp. ME-Dv--P-095]
MFSDEEWTRLIDKLRQLTELDKLEWNNNGLGGLYVEVGDITYLMEPKDSDGVAPYVLRVRNGALTNWNEIDSIVSVPGPELATGPATKITPLWELALRISQGGPALAQNLLADLDQIEPTPPPSYGSPF